MLVQSMNTAHKAIR